VNHDGSQYSAPASSTSQTLNQIQHVIWDGLYEHSRVIAIIHHLAQFLDLVAEHENETPRLDLTLLAHHLRDASDHLEMIESQLNCMFSLTNQGATRDIPDAHQRGERLRHIWAASDQTERRLIIQTARAVQGNIPVHGELTKFLQDMTEKHRSKDAEDDGEE
jgi:hypothetical protein